MVLERLGEGVGRVNVGPVEGVDVDVEGDLERVEVLLR